MRYEELRGYEILERAFTKGPLNNGRDTYIDPLFVTNFTMADGKGCMTLRREGVTVTLEVTAKFVSRDDKD